MEKINEPKKVAENKINIKLNINSEIINNNINISKKNSSKERSTEGATPTNTSQEKNSVTYYKDLLKEKEKSIDKLKSELENAKMIISKLKQNSNNVSVDNSSITANIRQELSKQISPKNKILTERKNSFKLDLNSKTINKDEIKNELFSDRIIPKTKNENELKSFTLNKNKKESVGVVGQSNNLSAYFRQSNKISYMGNKLSETSNYYF
jgi:hypothetical protein